MEGKRSFLHRKIISSGDHKKLNEYYDKMMSVHSSGPQEIEVDGEKYTITKVPPVETLRGDETPLQEAYKVAKRWKDFLI